MNFDFEINEISHKIDNFDSSRLKLDIKGKDVNYTVVNSIRRVCMNQIPIYALDRGKIKILRNSSVEDCTAMEVRLSQLPIKRINPNVLFLPLKYYKNVNFADPKIERHPEDNINIEYYINIKNNGPENILYVTTDHLRISINNEVIDNKTMYKGKEPITLIELRPGEEFECSMKAVLAVGEINAIFNASNSYYKEITENHYQLSVESNGQMDEYELLLRGINIIIEKMEIIKENITQQQYEIIITKNNSLHIEITNEDDTCGGPINWTLQNMKEVIFSGVSRPNFLEKKIMLTCSIDKNYKPVDILEKSINITIEQYKNIKKKIEKLSKKK